MGLGLIHMTLRIGSAWILLNLAAIGFFAALFCLEQARYVILRRRYAAMLRRRSATICIDQR